MVPITYLWLGKVKGGALYCLSLLNELLPVYQEILSRLAEKGIEWVQIDEPALVLDLPAQWQEAYQQAYQALSGNTKLLLTTYFDGISHHLDLIKSLPVQGLHVDVVAGADDIEELHKALPADWVLSLGIINGRNVWKYRFR